MSHQSDCPNPNRGGGDDGDELIYFSEINNSVKEDSNESKSDENEDDELSHNSCISSSNFTDNHLHNNANNRDKNNPSNLFELDNAYDDDFPLLFGGNHHGLESEVSAGGGGGGGQSGAGLVFPVGGMRRVSSCYFSIASAASSTNNNDYFTCVNGSGGGASGGTTLCNDNDHNSSTISPVHNFNNMDDFLLHDVLMNVFSYLDGRSLASFSETARRPNFECFYFLELQLQRALLVGDSHYYCGVSHCNCDDDDDNIRVDEDTVTHVQRENNDPHLFASNEVIPTFEGSIAGTGVISRLASMDREAARRIVQTYLDSNTSIHAMPLRHSLAYFRQVLLRYKQHPPFTSTSPASVPHGTTPNIPENMAKMALFFTFLGAAYVHHQGGDVMMPNIPSPSEVLNEENLDAFKSMMLKVGLAGGFLKAGKTMKAKAVQQQANVSSAAASASANDRVPDSISGADFDADYRGMDDISEVRVASTNAGLDISDRHRRDRSVGTTERIIGRDNSDTSEAAHNTFVSLAKDAQSSSQHQRSVSIGSLEDLSHMMPTASAIAFRLYNVFSNGNMPRHRPQMQNKDGSTSENAKVNKPLQASSIGNESLLSPRTRRRSKRSHNTLHPSEGDIEGIEANAADCSEDELNSFENEDEHLEGKISPDGAIAHAMHHPPSPSSVILNSAVTINGENNPEGAKPFFSFGDANQDSMSSSPVEDGNVPTGCVGAYAHAIKTAASEVTRLVKKDHRANFERLSLEEQTELGVRFIDACTSDDKLPIVKDILQKQKKMDVDRFFVGPDDTETCALHAGELFLQLF